MYIIRVKAYIIYYRELITADIGTFNCVPVASGPPFQFNLPPVLSLLCLCAFHCSILSSLQYLPLCFFPLFLLITALLFLPYCELFMSCVFFYLHLTFIEYSPLFFLLSSFFFPSKTRTPRSRAVAFKICILYTLQNV